MVVRGTHPINHEGRNGVTSKPTSHRGMEKFGVLVAFQGIPNFGSSPPIQGPFSDREMKSIHSEGAKEVFQGGGEGTPFLQEVKELDKKTAVLLPLGARGNTSCPFLAFGTAELEARNQPCSGICPVGGVPSASYTGTEARMKGPGGLKPKEAPPYGSRWKSWPKGAHDQRCHER
jgi:hypothetical protein